MGGNRFGSGFVADASISADWPGDCPLSTGVITLAHNAIDSAAKIIRRRGDFPCGKTDSFVSMSIVTRGRRYFTRNVWLSALKSNMFSLIRRIMSGVL